MCLEQQQKLKFWNLWRLCSFHSFKKETLGNYFTFPFKITCMDWCRIKLGSDWLPPSWIGVGMVCYIYSQINILNPASPLFNIKFWIYVERIKLTTIYLVDQNSGFLHENCWRLIQNSPFFYTNGPPVRLQLVYGTGEVNNYLQLNLYLIWFIEKMWYCKFYYLII